MEERLLFWERFLQLPAVGIVRNLSFEDIQEILPRYLSAGLTTIEITLNTPDAEKIIRHIGDQYTGKLNVGAGTVCNLDDLHRALEAGARFIVTPIVKAEVISACKQADIPIFPGAFTPTEIYKAWEMGADMIKVFPATTLGPQYIKDVKAPLAQIKLLPTGGVDIHNCGAFFQAGATGLGLGSQLFDKTMIKEQNWEALSSHFGLFVKAIRSSQSV